MTLYFLFFIYLNIIGFTWEWDWRRGREPAIAGVDLINASNAPGEERQHRIGRHTRTLIHVENKYKKGLNTACGYDRPQDYSLHNSIGTREVYEGPVLTTDRGFQLDYITTSTGSLRGTRDTNRQGAPTQRRSIVFRLCLLCLLSPHRPLCLLTPAGESAPF